MKSNLCDTYVLVRGNITVNAAPEIQVAFKHCAPFTKCITKIDETTIDDAEDLDLVMPMYNLIEYSANYSETTRILWFYSIDEAINFNNNIANTNNFKYFKYKAKFLENTVADGANGILRNTTNAVPLNYLSNFWRSLEMPLINCKVELKLKWTKYCVLSAAGNENESDNDNNDNANNIIFTIKGTILYVPVVTLSTRDNKKVKKFLSKGFESSVYWNEYKTIFENKNTANEFRYFSNQISLESIDCLF